jgi:hypothetical protein
MTDKQISYGEKAMQTAGAKLGLATIAIFLTVFAGWITHIVWVIKLLMNGEPTMGHVALAVIGAIAPPVGAIHGVYLWFA